MSRLIVKGLPKHLTEERLRTQFSVAGEVTDAKIRRTKDGKSRQFGFVGFRSEAEAREAIRMFNNTYLDTSKMSLYVAQPYGNEAIPRGWSKYTRGTSRYLKAHPEETVESEAPKVAGKREEEANVATGTKVLSVEEDAKFREFLAAAQPRHKKKIWANDDDEDALVEDHEQQLQNASQKKIVVKSKKAGGEGLLLTRTHMKFENAQAENLEDMEAVASAAESSVSFDDDEEGEDDAVEDNVARKKEVSDLDYLRTKMTSEFQSDEDGAEDDDEGGEAKEAEEGGEKLVGEEKDAVFEGEKREEKRTERDAAVEETRKRRDGGKRREQEEEEEEEEDEEPVSESGRLFVRNLPYSATEEDLEEVFERQGALAEVHLCVDSTTKQSKGMAFVLYVVPENAVKAIAELDGTIFMGRLLHILPAKRKPPAKEENLAVGMPGMSSFKLEREMQRKEAAKSKSDIVAYNPLFMSSDDVASALADKYSAEKSEVFGDENAAVRLAAGEARLQEEAREVLKREGVNVEAFSMMEKTSMKTKRSKTIILVKNLPAGTTQDQINDRFINFGQLGRVVVVPSGLIALVEFIDAGDARRAFGSIAYSRFRDKPVYLEWAPLEAFKTPAKAGALTAKRPPKESMATEKSSGDSAKDDDDAVVESATVFVKNLNFITDDDALRKLFGKSAKIRSARVARKKVDGKSLGYGFVEFESPDEAGRNVRKNQGWMLDGHALELKLSDGGKRTKRKGEDGGGDGAGQGGLKDKEGKTAKLLVKNLAFEANQKEVRKLFASYGEIKSVKLPRKFDGTHRGFAFVEFKSKSEAAAAKDYLRATHFYARRLVIEYAKDDITDTVGVDEAMEERMNESSKRARPTKRRKTDPSAGTDPAFPNSTDYDEDVNLEMYN